MKGSDGRASERLGSGSVIVLTDEFSATRILPYFSSLETSAENYFREGLSHILLFWGAWL